MNSFRLEISKLEKRNLDEAGMKAISLPESYVVRIFQKANELGLDGKKIKEVISITDPVNGAQYLDFICD